MTTFPDLHAAVRTVPDFPKKGIMFRDITTLLKDGPAFCRAVDLLEERYRGAGIDKVVGIESRGFILGGALASRLGVGFVPVRKPGKLPAPQSGRHTSWSTEPIRWRCTPTQSARGRRY